MHALLIDCILKPGPARSNPGAVMDADTTMWRGRLPLLQVTAP
ncbi:hypothetical protein ABTZ21_12725 [Streptomyces sp. NPDC096191]